jgi:hypothetical protein
MEVVTTKNLDDVGRKGGTQNYTYRKSGTQTTGGQYYNRKGGTNS